MISWALILCLPASALLSFLFRPGDWGLVAGTAWLGFAYVSLMSQFLGFVFWYAGLALGGVAEVSQFQLLQGFLTITGSALYLHEAVPAEVWICMGLVILSIVFSRRALASR